MTEILPSWREGAARSAILEFLGQVDDIPPGQRVAVFDNDGTMWCEKPNHAQAEFVLHELRSAVAADNSAGDAEMLQYAQGYDGPSLALLVDHDDAEREYAYASVAGTFDDDETILETAARLGWVVASIKDDWATVFAGS